MLDREMMKKTTRTRKYLFICALGINRSPTATQVAKDIASRNNIKINASHLEGGIYNEDLEDLDSDGRKSFGARLSSYDKLFVMQDYMADRLVYRYHTAPKKIVVLNISDDYPRNSQSLIDILEKKLEYWIK